MKLNATTRHIYKWLCPRWSTYGFGRTNMGSLYWDSIWAQNYIPDFDVGSSGHVGGGGDGEVMKSLFGHRVRCRWCLNDWFGCQENDMRRDDASSNPSNELLWIFSEVCWQRETSHTLPCPHPSRENKSNISNSYFLNTLPRSCIGKSFNQCHPQQQRQKWLLAFLSVATRIVSPQRWR
jgi:hypothetical protein